MPSKKIQTRTEVLQKFNLTQSDIVRVFNDDECALDSLADNNEIFRFFVVKKNGTEILLGDMPPDAVFSIRFRSITFKPETDSYSYIDITSANPPIKGSGGIRIEGTTIVKSIFNILKNDNLYGAVIGGESVVAFSAAIRHSEFGSGGAIVSGVAEIDYLEANKYFEIGSGGILVGSNNTYYGVLFDKNLIISSGVLCAGQALVYANTMELVFDTSKEGGRFIDIAPAGTVNITVYWGDGTSNTYNTAGTKTHSYSNDGIYNVIIDGTMTGYGLDDYFYAPSNLVRVVSFSRQTTDLSYAFSGAKNLTEVPSAIPSTVTKTSHMFNGAIAFNQDISTWNTSKVTNMSGMFRDCSVFDQPLNSWDVSKVTNMSNMFLGTTVFNQPLNSWNTSNVISTALTFNGAIAFNQDISTWNTSKVTNMSGMFAACYAFDQPLNSWDVSKVTDMSDMFYGASVFDQPLNSWNVSRVNNMRKMFSDASKFNQSLNSWLVGSVQDMSYMFTRAIVFNGNITSWNTSNVTDMESMFENATAFNQSIGSWNVSNVTNMSYMFWSASNFNQSISSWNVSKVSYFHYMFKSSIFNQPLDSWNVSSGEYFVRMFEGSQFNQDISTWDFTNIFLQSPAANLGPDTYPLYNFFSGAMSVSNMNSVLINWDTNKNSLPNDLRMGYLPQTPTGAGATAKTSLETNKGWYFT